ncbi:acyltransferase ChoActase/COT/CPT [Acaromyces ingoldii]|uniref:Acyltransferase ChoActase/COT/CPT n=1 Tax=Acaromyces ingoldii TaxID=215250 RepID=A0A316YP08_9BASI|nr:acyltransferase ChoActase/COT/CPT [Acaromyces ingoldii]PWN90766.1 acyltransferase ChoActase/COT/CPT [Acaromyces ingoldii]
MIVASLARRSIHSSRPRPLATLSSTYAASSSLFSSTRRPFGTSAPTMFALTPFRGAPGAVQPKTFSRQGELHRLPIPQLNDTFERYLTTLEPLLRQAEEFGELDAGKTAAEELDKRRAWAREALKPGSLVNRLQQRLIDVDRTTPNNWLDDRFWLQKAYHEWRVPLLVNSNWWLMCRADPDTPAAALEQPGAQAEKSGTRMPAAKADVALGANSWQAYEHGLRRATWLIHRMLEFKRRLDTQDIVPDASRAGAFCMHQYTRVFGVTRIPAIPHDWNTASVHPAKSKHITVICRNNFYHVDVLAEDGTGLPLEDIERALYEIVADARKADGPAVGVLTSDGRDEWARAREHLLTSPTNAASMRSIEDSLFNVSLDSDVLTLPSDHAGAPHSATPDSVDAHARNTSGAGRGGHNRWFDKAMSLVVEPNGRAGLMGEHSPCDALIPSIVIDFCLGVPSPKPHEAFPSVPQTAEKGSGKGVKWSKLAWELDAQTEANIASASEAARKIAAGSDIGMLWYDEYGAEWIKKVGKQSPDAYLQLVLQVAFANVKGRQSPTYETASTRLYRHGRTDVIRSFSKEAYEFVKGLRDGLSTKELYPLLSKATQAHNAQTRSSSMGKGIDRHLTGLRLVYDSQEDGPVPESEEKHVDSWKGAQLLFNDPLLAQSQTWKLSTSGLSAGDRFAGTGFGAGYPDGYGINYLAGNNLLKFGIESKHPDQGGESGPNPTKTLATAIVDALRVMREICEKEAPAVAEAEAKKAGKL